MNSCYLTSYGYLSFFQMATYQSFARLLWNSILNLICNRCCGFISSYVRQRTLESFSGWPAFYGMRIPWVKLPGLHSDRMWRLGSPFLGQGSLLVCFGPFLGQGSCLVPHHVFDRMRGFFAGKFIFLRLTLHSDVRCWGLLLIPAFSLVYSPPFLPV